MNNIAVDIGGNQLPESRLLWTNAQMVANDVLLFIGQIGKQINDRNNRAALEEAIKLP